MDHCAREAFNLESLRSLSWAALLTTLFLGAVLAFEPAVARAQSGELCNEIDDDGDGEIDEGFAVGMDCAVADGACETGGVTLCRADGSGIECVPFGDVRMEEPEGPGEDGSCFDFSDNDCDGLTDHEDPDCRTAEYCNGLDNDGNGEIDEIFADLGEACSVGQGACVAGGVRVCRADKSGTTCSATAQPASPEGPSGATCADGEDNDCDGLTDAADPSCGSAELTATCALPRLRGHSGAACGGWHEIQIGALGAPEGASITGELLALDAGGNVLGSLPVENGDTLHATSSLRSVNLQSNNGRHQVTAPLPMLRVTVDDGRRRVQAYCSTLPFLDVVEPASGVVVSSQGEAVRVTVAMPLVDPATLGLTLDGVDVLASLGIDPATKLPGGPFAGHVLVDGRNVEVSELVVASAAPGIPSSNTLRMQLAGLPGGGHALGVSGGPRPGLIPDPASAQCLLDDLQERLSIASFEITVDSPLPGAILSDVPALVLGEVRHGLEIESLSINGLRQDVSGQFTEPANGGGVSYVLPIEVLVPQTDLLDEVEGVATSVGTFDAGPNRLAILAQDSEGNRAIASHLFAVGDVHSGAATASFAGGPVASALAFGDGEGVEVQDALAVGFVPDAIDGLFRQDCLGRTAEFEAEVDQQLRAFLDREIERRARRETGQCLGPEGAACLTNEDCGENAVCQTTGGVCPGDAEVSGVCRSLEDECTKDSDCGDDGSCFGKLLLPGDPDVPAFCDPKLTFSTTGASFAPMSEVECRAFFGEARLTTQVELPEIQARIDVNGYCEGTWHSIKLKTFVEVSLDNATGCFALGEDDFLGLLRGGTATPEVSFGIHEEDITTTTGPLDVDGGGTANVIDVADFLGWAGVLIVGVVLIFATGGLGTLVLGGALGAAVGLVGAIFLIIGLLIANSGFGFSVGALAFKFPQTLDGLGLDEEQLASAELDFQASPQAVKIRPGGMTILLSTLVSPMATDPEIPPIPGAVATIADPPMPPLEPVDQSQVFFSISDDAVNTILASMTAKGDFKSPCLASDKNLRDLQPEDCTTANTDAAGVVDDQGRVLCEALKAENCDDLQDLQSRNACAALASVYNISGDTRPLGCLRLETPPRILIRDDFDADNAPVETPDLLELDLRLNDARLFVVLDRDLDGLDEDDEGKPVQLPALSSCTNLGGPRDLDCLVLDVCLDLNIIAADLRLDRLRCLGAPGVSCDENGDCAAGQICDDPTSGDMDTTRFCRSQGSVCGHDGNCALGEVCDEKSPALELHLGEFRLDKNCLGPAGASCEDTTDCSGVEELCVGSSCRSVGAACTTDEQCAVGEVCGFVKAPGFVCGGDVTVVSPESVLSSPALEDVRLSIDVMTPLLQPSGLSLGGIGRLTEPRILGVQTSEAERGFDDYMCIVGNFALNE